MSINIFKTKSNKKKLIIKKKLNIKSKIKMGTFFNLLLKRYIKIKKINLNNIYRR